MQKICKKLFIVVDVLLCSRFEILWLTLCQLHNEFVIEVSTNLSLYTACIYVTVYPLSQHLQFPNY